MTTNEILKQMIGWLCDNQLAVNQTEVARVAGISSVNVSRIINGYVKSTKLETLRKVNAAYGNPFNPEWLRGESDVMLLADLLPDTTTGETTMDVSVHAQTDLTTELIAAKDELIRAKDDIIATLRAQLADKDALIQSLRQQVYDRHA